LIDPIKPINITIHQEQCANTFGIDFDIKFCHMPVEMNQKQTNSIHNDPQDITKSAGKDKQNPPKRKGTDLKDLMPSMENCLGLSSFC
jgi:hypothetical protein